MIRVVSRELGTKHRMLTETLASATTRLAAGEAPTDDAEREWGRLQERDGAQEAHMQAEVRRHRRQ